ncbi:lytic transglycosylase domain-containing protein [Dyella telluris]|uniref:Transglycosylase SLT domain-containing protein n=1 Tax=Dyella telluris TaxID=2763498 RepID=A0A7G8Q0T1_9GAMM|nr:lytic transglycosylase domain-containing protein [Dyella telluris]QNK00389.1 transglycosylase SLT domain-containing protein [Dyella telluris]
MTGLPRGRLRAQAWRRLAGACLVLVGILVFPDTVHAGALYKCTGTSGEVVFSSSAAGYQGCTRIAGAPDPVRKKAPAATATPSLTAVTGSADTTAGKAVTASAPQPASIAWVQDSVETTARVVPPGQSSPVAASAGKPEQGGYREVSPGDPVPAPDKPVANPGTRVLSGTVYRVKSKDGTVEYTNVKPAGEKTGNVAALFGYYEVIKTCTACDLHSNVRWDAVALHLGEYGDVIQLASQESGVDEAFLRAIIHAESAFNPRALSVKGAQGLMQLMPGTAMDMGVRDAFDTAQNIRGGARYLGLLMRTFNGNERLAAAAYNSGPANVQKYNGVPPFAETQVYVERVGTLRKRYGLAIHPGGGRSPVAAAGVSAIQ